MKKLKRFLSTRVSSSQRHPAPSTIPTAPAVSTKVNDAVGICRLEQVPFDIRHQILLALDSIEDLTALVHASPIYYRQHLPRREFWLWHCLWLDLDRTMADAYTVHISNSHRFRKKRTLKSTQRFIAEYEMRGLATAEELFDLPTTEDITSMIHFHMTVIQPLLHEYVAWTRGNLPALCTPPSLSQSERRRIFRGLYRFQLFCNMFGKLPSTRGHQTVEGQHRFDLFNTFEPWEVEEVVCINTFADEKYEAVFTEIQKDLEPDPPKSDSGRIVFTPPGAYRLQTSPSREYYRNGIISLGLAHLLATFNAKEHSRLVALTAENMTYGDDWFDDVTWEYNQKRRREAKPTERDKAQSRRDEMLFCGDQVAAPPLAWVTIWRGVYSNIWGEHIPTSIRAWGYVMWDADRLIRTGSLAVLKQQWGEMWILPEGEVLDPRDYM